MNSGARLVSKNLGLAENLSKNLGLKNLWNWVSLDHRFAGDKNARCALSSGRNCKLDLPRYFKNFAPMIGSQGAANSDTAVNHFPTWSLAVGDHVVDVIDLPRVWPLDLACPTEFPKALRGYAFTTSCCCYFCN